MLLLINKLHYLSIPFQSIIFFPLFTSFTAAFKNLPEKITLYNPHVMLTQTLLNMI